jgi:hypothetical protein
VSVLSHAIAGGVGVKEAELRKMGESVRKVEEGGGGEKMGKRHSRR